MAKCIKYLSNEVIERVHDDDALRIVLSGAAMYTSKGAWKSYNNGARKSLAFDAAIALSIKNKKTVRKDKKRKSKLEVTLDLLKAA